MLHGALPRIINPSQASEAMGAAWSPGTGDGDDVPAGNTLTAAAEQQLYQRT